MARRDIRYVLLCRAPFGDPREWWPVPETRTDHIGQLMEQGWIVIGIDSDILGPVIPLDPAQSSPNIGLDDEGGD